MTIVLAGHVDHGKSSLVRAITGIDTDRLAEEKRRGLTIDLGFAYLHRDGRTLGFVDVPGHHRFIHNMVAGVAATQTALLVVAADDGPMPQTREHLDIMRVLGLRRGVIAITKIDRIASAERPHRLEELRHALRALCKATFLADAPVFAVSSATGDGIPDLINALWQAAAPSQTSEPTETGFRLAIDRAFQPRGIGTVVTGTVVAGSVSLQDELTVFPSGERVRVRELRVQNASAERAMPGDRCALNLSGGEQLTRGDWLSSLAPVPHREVTLDVELLGAPAQTLRHGQQVHLYHGTRHVQARIALFHPDPPAPGGRGRLLLRLDAPLLAKRGDRLLLRDQGLDHTLGGGVVIANQPLPGRLRDPARQRWLDAFAQPDPAASLQAALELGPVDLEAFANLWDLPKARLEVLLQDRPAQRLGQQVVLESQLEQWRETLLADVRRAATDTTQAGVKANSIGSGIPVLLRDRLLSDLVTAGALVVRAGRFDLPARQVRLSDAEQALLDRIQPLLADSQPAALGDIAKRLRQPLARLQQSLKPLESKGVVVRIGPNRVLLPDTLLPLRELALELERFNVRTFRDRCGFGRNLVIEILEYFDQRGFTQRQGDDRVILDPEAAIVPGGPAGRLAAAARR